jgi:hypothetical protein
MLVVLVDLGVDPGDLIERGDLVKPGYERLGHDSLRAEHQLLHGRHHVDDVPVQGADRGGDQGRL